MFQYFVVRMVACAEREIFVKAADGKAALLVAEAMAKRAGWGEEPRAVSATLLSGKREFLPTL